MDDCPADLILTATDRQARALREDYSLRRRRAGARVWEAPAVQSLRQWLQDAWTASWPAEQLLHAAQELALWRQTIERDEAGAQLLAPLAAAREARRAEQLLLRHAIDPAALAQHREDHAAFARWRRELRARMRRRGWLTAGDLYLEVARRLDDGRLRAPPRIALAGFVGEPLAAERRVFAALERAGSVLRMLPPPAQAARIGRSRHADAESQFRAIAADARRRLQGDGTAELPRLILALPDPDGRRELLESILRPALAPWLQRLDGSPRPLPWRWDAGAPLAEQPLIAVALAVAELRLADNAPALAGRVLLSSALWSDAERALTAAADLYLRDKGWPRLRYARLLEACPGPLRARFAALGECLERAPRRALPSAWAQHWRERLQALGWPGREPLDSAGFQALREWERLLARLSAMDAQLAQTGAGEALSWLRELARSSRFEPRVEYAQPLLIVKLEDAAGLPCDVLYLADLGADRFPARESASPYLPLEAQLAAGVPGAAPARLLARARELAAQLLQLAPEVQLSYAAVDERGAQIAPSPLFGAEHEWIPASAPGPISGLERAALRGPRCALPAEDPVPPMSAQEIAQLRAGSLLFKAWFESPFFAFGRYRLGVAPLPQPARGLDARRQGNVAHAVLEQLWRELGDSAELARRSSGELRARIDAALDPALAEQMPGGDYGRVQIALERARLADVLAQWMEHERKRLDPFRVEHVEAEISVTVGGLPLKLRIDRIDRVSPPDGRERWLVMDYKSGRNADPRGWNAETFAEPQLPLYASHAAAAAIGVPHVDGICFGHLKDGHPAFVAATDWRKKLIEGELQDLRDDWQQKLSLWHLRLTEAAQRFAAGEAWLAATINERSYYADLLLLANRHEEDEPA